MPKKKIKLIINNQNEKIIKEINKLQSDLDILKNQVLTNINISNKDFDLTKPETPKVVKFSPSFYDNLNETEINPYPINFKTKEPMINDITFGEQAIKYIANAYKEFITDIPEYFNLINFNNNWVIKKINETTINNIYLIKIVKPQKYTYNSTSTLIIPPQYVLINMYSDNILKNKYSCGLIKNYSHYTGGTSKWVSKNCVLVLFSDIDLYQLSINDDNSVMQINLKEDDYIIYEYKHKNIPSPLYLNFN